MLGCWKVDVRVRVRKSNVRGGIKGKIRVRKNVWVLQGRYQGQSKEIKINVGGIKGKIRARKNVRVLKSKSEPG